MNPNEIAKATRSTAAYSQGPKKMMRVVWLFVVVAILSITVSLVVIEMKKVPVEKTSDRHQNN